MRWIRKLLGTDYPNPAVGQVWRSGHNGEEMRVSDVHIDTQGGVSVTVTRWIPSGSWTGLGPNWGIGEPYCYGLSQWRTRLRNEKRILVDSIEVL